MISFNRLLCSGFNPQLVSVVFCSLYPIQFALIACALVSAFKKGLGLLEYMPGHCLPLHYDGFEGFKKIYKKDNSTRFFVAVSDWDWGHVLQVHNNIISNWNPGDTYIIPAGVCHASANFGIAPKYTLTVTGVRR